MSWGLIILVLEGITNILTMPAQHFFCIDAHTCGNPVRLVVNGGPGLKSASIADKRKEFLRDHDWIRQGLMFEPRGHDMMSGSILYPPENPMNDAAVLFLETSGCLPMCGHGLIGTVTIATERRFLKPKESGKLRLETPAGLVEARFTMEGEKVASVGFTNVPSFVLATDLLVESSELGEVRFDLSYGGNIYAIVEPQSFYKGLDYCTSSELIAWSRSLRMLINAKYSQEIQQWGRGVVPDPAVTHMMWTDRPVQTTSTARNAVFFGEKGIDRSPCGTGTSARMAQWHHRGALQPGEPFVHESIIGSTFTGRVREIVEIAGSPAIIPEITGWARIYGENRIEIDTDNDPYALGFQVI